MGESKTAVEDDILGLLDARMRRIVEEVVRITRPMPAADVLDEKTRREVREQTLLSHKTYMTRSEAARYLQVSEKSIGEWSRRPSHENPLPVAYVGADPRYRRTALDEWAAREAGRRLAG